ncbi:MAG: isochorismatase family protein [Planctomycetes bacterium]|nr:isochorismatase family protein [Planctomycetota bacterium]
MMTTFSMANDFTLELRHQTETAPDSGRYHRVTREETWNTSETAVIVCDVWDYHHSLNAVRRLEEFAPRLDEVLKRARSQGAIIIHSPSDCMDAYSDHPARARAIATPKASSLPDDIKSWCSRIPAEEQAVYPLDQSDGGSDDDPEEHTVWAARLKKLGRDPGLPWQKQSDLISIDSDKDYISDRGDEVWSILEQRGIKNVILTGVHVNMCVLGRPFGLRQMARNGKHVVLMRDMTDTMYNPARWPYVSHFTGNDLIVSHIERFVCPTVTSDQLIGGETFRFKNDTRPHLAIVMAEREYETERTLPKFAAEHLGKDFRISFVHADETDRNRIPGLEVLRDADVALISVRRRTLQPARLKIVRDFVAAGKPVIGIRTASHAFSLRNEPAAKGLADWPEFDAQVLGGHYTNHHGNKLQSTVRTLQEAIDHPILHGLTKTPFAQGGSLYMTSPLASSAIQLLKGSVDGKPAEPVAWTFERADGGSSFYTSLGHPDDFENKEFLGLLKNGIYWAAGVPTESFSLASNVEALSQRWSLTSVPTDPPSSETPLDNKPGGTAWYRCAFRPGEVWLADGGLKLQVAGVSKGVQAWFNGHELKVWDRRFGIRANFIEPNDANLIVLRMENGQSLSRAPRVISGKKEFALQGKWQFRLGDDPAWSNIPLPARYGTSPDILFEP